jgi:hypothetical protein
MNAMSATNATVLRGFVLSSLLAAAACSVLGSPSRVRTGQLYAPGSARYDAYFGEVHATQVAEASWPEERKNTRKPLLDALTLVPDADDAAIEQATKDRLSSGILRLEVKGTDVHVVENAATRHEGPQDILVAVETTAHGEVERAKKLSELPARIEALAKTGRELEDHIAEDFNGDGQKPFEVKEELHASYDVLYFLSQNAMLEKKAADQFVAELGRAVSTGSEVVAAPAAPLPKAKPAKGTPKPEPKREAPTTKPARTEPPVARADTSPPPPKSAPPPPPPKPAPPPPPPKPAAKSSDSEVFNP